MSIMKTRIGKLNLKTFTILILLVLFFIVQLPKAANAQASGGASHKHTSADMKWYTDSIEKTPYRYGLPFLGVQVQKLGFDIPYPIGVMLTGTYTQQSITINDLAISRGLDSTYYEVSQIVDFSSVKPLVYEFAFRPDVWIFPFFNVSGLFGYFESNTEVKMDQPFAMTFPSKNSGSLIGYGLMVAGGAGPIFATLGYNQIWSFTETLLNPGISYEAALRIGHNHKNRKDPWKGWSVWIGAEWLQLNKETLGAVNLNTLTGISQEDKQQAADDLDAWWDGPDNPLNPIEKKALEPIKDDIDGWLRNDTDAILYYDFVKEMVNPFSFVVGGQYQFSKHWQVQAEGTFTGERYRATLAFNYRFGFKLRKANTVN